MGILVRLEASVSVANLCRGSTLKKRFELFALVLKNGSGSCFQWP